MCQRWSGRIDFKCSIVCKIPIIEWDFWINQKTSRKIVIGKIDAILTDKLQRLVEGKRKVENLEVETRRKTNALEQLNMEYSPENEDNNNSYNYNTEMLEFETKQKPIINFLLFWVLFMKWTIR